MNTAPFEDGALVGELQPRDGSDLKIGSAGGSSSGSSGNRWDPNILNELECKNVFVDDADEHLPDTFDTENVNKVKRDDCALCSE